DAYPGHSILAEESGAAGKSEFQWIVDPLDGTTNFLHGHPHWAISIALEHKGEIVSAVVYDPVKDEMFTAERGAGAWLNDRRLRVSGRRDMAACLFATGLPFAARGSIGASLQELARLLPLCAGVRRYGAAALDLTWVAAGRFDGFWEQALHPWDIAAGLLIVREAGGLVGSLLPGDPMATGSVIAANGAMFEPLAKVLKG
ncbi:MAG TPA: inositol monophosphatase family protein, partial [Paracoccaceae bacterium]|nr:inositol monophosphatase family protein [Paracoccaceae bacterium]